MVVAEYKLGMHRLRSCGHGFSRPAVCRNFPRSAIKPVYPASLQGRFLTPDHQGSPCITFLMFQNLPMKQQNDFHIFPFEGQANLNVMSTNERACLVSWTFKCYGMTCQLCITTNTSTFGLCRMRNILSVRYSFLCSWHLIALNPSWAWRASCDNLLSNPWGTVLEDLSGHRNGFICNDEELVVLRVRSKITEALI